MRAQTNLPAIAIALLVLTTTAGLGMALADAAFGGAEREADERRVAVALSERLVDPDGPLTGRANVLEERRLENLSESRLRRLYPVVANHDVRVRVADRTVVERGTPAGGTTIRRIALLQKGQTQRYDPNLDVGNTTTLPRRTDRVNLTVDTPNGTALQTVRANDRVVLHNTSGLEGTVAADVSRFETTTLGFAANGSLSTGDVTVTYVPTRETKATLEVTVDGS